ncbi:MAG: hypothetical protein WCS01_08750 [bacterium]
MRKSVMMAVGVLVASAMVSMANCGSCPGDKAAAGGKAKMECKDIRPRIHKHSPCGAAGGKAKMECKDMAIYACAKCKTVADEAGKCSKCSADLAKMHVLACKDGQATLCACAGDCKCTVKADDATKCSCGKDVVTVSVASTKCGAACKAAAAK